MRLVTLKRRVEFQGVRGGARASTSSFVLECKPRRVPVPSAGPRFGFTITKKIGNAVERNRIRRRFREILRSLPDAEARGDCDYVIVARREALTRTFAALKSDLARALAAVHRGGARTRATPEASPGGAPAPLQSACPVSTRSSPARPSSTHTDDRPEE